MGTEKYRRKAYFKGSVTVVGTLTAKSGFTSDGVLSVNTPMALKTTSSTVQFAGTTRVGCSVATITISSTVVRSNAVITLTPQVAPGHTMANTSYVLGPLTVMSLSDSNYMTIGWLTGLAAINQQVDVMWTIALPKS